MIIKRLDLNALPFSLTNKTPVLPDFPVAYVIFSDEAVFYVGATKSLFNRWGGHLSSWKIGKVLKRKNVKVAWVKATIEQLPVFESALINFLNPKLNMMRGSRTYHHAHIKRPNRKPSRLRLETNGNGHK